METETLKAVRFPKLDVAELPAYFRGLIKTLKADGKSVRPRAVDVIFCRGPAVWSSSWRTGGRVAPFGETVREEYWMGSDGEPNTTYHHSSPGPVVDAYNTFRRSGSKWEITVYVPVSDLTFEALTLDLESHSNVIKEGAKALALAALEVPRGNWKCAPSPTSVEALIDQPSHASFMASLGLD